MTYNRYAFEIATIYTETMPEPNGCAAAVPSGRPVYIRGSGNVDRGMDAVDLKDIAFRALPKDMLRNAPRSIDEPSREVGDILLPDGLHRAFMSYTGLIYVDGLVY